ncbi:DUF2726 domain-containing protein [Tichowtungia aerotolerans]|uniref:DUF2726 domain-containing protein n=1 Tax=Tichowtungia aerotolerans TaxID=2697043 RepID=A0A6P1M3D2_9BACT|nr:DUF2726 domain-containing protein [Tichowtungia aerotolerans]QHI69120.1 DUF2726 domain-containing protein [Tichowtungia aerotolerans]
MFTAAIEAWKPAIMVFGVVAVLYILLQILNSRPRRKNYEYKSCGTILTPAEQTFYKALKEAVGETAGISLKSRLADILQPDAKGKEHHAAFCRIRSKHVDFLLYDPVTFQIKAAIELDDKSHRQPKRKQRDDFVNHAFQTADIPLHRFKVQKQYDSQQITEKLEPTENQNIKS